MPRAPQVLRGPDARAQQDRGRVVRTRRRGPPGPRRCARRPTAMRDERAGDAVSPSKREPVTVTAAGDPVRLGRSRTGSRKAKALFHRTPSDDVDRHRTDALRGLEVVEVVGERQSRGRHRPPRTRAAAGSARPSCSGGRGTAPAPCRAAARRRRPTSRGCRAPPTRRTRSGRRRDAVQPLCAEHPPRIRARGKIEAARAGGTGGAEVVVVRQRDRPARPACRTASVSRSNAP